MSEVLRELVVSLSLNSDNFSRNMRTISKQIKEAESTFRLAGAGVDKFEKSIAGTEAKLSMLGQKLTQQNRAVDQYARALIAANTKLQASHDKQEQLKASLASARGEYERIGQQVQTASTKYQEYVATLGESNSATLTAKQNLAALKDEHKAAGDAVKKIEGQITAVSKTMQNNADAISTTKTNLNNAKVAVKETEAEIKKLTQQLYTMQSGWTKAGEGLTAFAKKCDTVSKTLVKAGKGMSAAITTPLVALGTAAVKASIEYEDAFTSVRKTVDATEEEFAGFSDAIKQMSTQVAASTSDIAEVMAMAGQLGIENKYLESFSRTMIDLGNSTDIVASEAATLLARFANITGMDQSQFDRLGSALVDLGNNYATTESEIVAMSTRLAAAGHQIGLTEPQILGFATALSSVGIKAEMGGSAFSKALINMEVAVETGGDALKDFAKVAGLTEKEFSKLWKADPAAAFQSFIVGLSKMDEEGASAIATLNEIGITEIRLRDTIMRATNATELFSKGSWVTLWGLLDGAALDGVDKRMNQQFSGENLANLQTYVSEMVAAIQNGSEVSQEDLANLENIVAFLGSLELTGTGENIRAGVAAGMTEAGWDTDAETVASSLESALNLALGIQSPSTRVKPVGENVAAGVGAGMAVYDLSMDAAALAFSLSTAVETAVPGDALAAIGTGAATGLASAISTYSMASTGSAVGKNVKSAVSSALTSSTLRSIGVNAMAGLKAGIEAGKSGVVSAMKSAATAAVSAAKKQLKIASPSGVFRDEVGRMTMKGFGQGVLLESKLQARTVANAARYLTGAAQGGSISTTANDNRRTYNQTSSVNLSGNTFYVRDEQDIRSLAMEIATLTKRQQRGRGLKMA